MNDVNSLNGTNCELSQTFSLSESCLHHLKYILHLTWLCIILKTLCGINPLLLNSFALFSLKLFTQILYFWKRKWQFLCLCIPKVFQQNPNGYNLLKWLLCKISSQYSCSDIVIIFLRHQLISLNVVSLGCVKCQGWCCWQSIRQKSEMSLEMQI